MLANTIAQIVHLSSELTGVSDTPRLDIEVLLCHVLGKERTYLFTWPDKELSEQQRLAFNTAFERRKNGEPVAHIIGVREFWSLPLAVTPSTLIPRPDTELLVEQALQLPLPDNAQVLDLGTGSGAIALALASERPDWKIDAVDVIPNAVALAERNRKALGFDRVTVFQSSWYDALNKDAQYSLIISNPPYIDPQDPHLAQGDVRFEPHSALVANNHGLADIELIAEGAKKYLANDGWLAVEHGYDQGELVRAVFDKTGFTRIQTCQDLGGNDRITLAGNFGGVGC